MNKKIFFWALDKLHSKPDIFFNQTFYNDLSRLTIIIPSYERPDYLIRAILYLLSLPVYIKVVDSSKKPLPKAIRNAFLKFKKLEYFHLKLSMPDRIRFAAKNTTTDFIACMADDDFYLPHGLHESMLYLEKRKGDIACMGQSIGLDIFNEEPFLFPYGTSLNNYKVRGKSAKKRILLGIRDYRSAAFYAIYKTSVFKKIWSNIERSSCPEMIEYEHAIMVYAYGNLSTSNDVYWVRSFECDAVSGSLDGDRKITFNKWVSCKFYNAEKEFFIKRLSDIFTKKLDLSKSRSREFVIEVLSIIRGNSHFGLMNYAGQISFFYNIKKLIERTFLRKLLNSFLGSIIGVYFKKIIHLRNRKLLYKSYKQNPRTNKEYTFLINYVDSFLKLKNY